MSINGIGNYGYFPQQTAFTSKRYNPPADFKPGIYDPQAEERNRKRKNNILKVIGLAVLATGTYLFLKKTNMGKKLVERLKGLIKGTKHEASGTVPTSVKPKKAKVKTQKAVVAEHVGTADVPTPKTHKMKGKDEAHKVRRNKKAIIEETRLKEEMRAKAEAFTTKDLDEYHKSLGTPATSEERAFINANNKEATNTMADVMESKGIQRAKDKNGRVVLEQKPVQAPKIEAPKVEIPNAERIADIQARIAKNDEIIARFSKPGMEKYAKGAQAARTKLLAELETLQKAAA